MSTADIVHQMSTPDLVRALRMIARDIHLPAAYRQTGMLATYLRETALRIERTP